MQFYLCNVGFGVEVSEEYDERNHVNNKSVMHPQGEFAASSDSVNSEYKGSCELNELENGQILLPPQVFRHVWSQGRETVIRVHQDVDETIYHGWQEG